MFLGGRFSAAFNFPRRPPSLLLSVSARNTPGFETNPISFAAPRVLILVAAWTQQSKKPNDRVTTMSTTICKRSHSDDEDSTAFKRQRGMAVINEDASTIKDQDTGSVTSMTEEERQKLDAKRAYNRLNAARARKRTKDQLSSLCRKVESYSDKNEQLEASNQDLLKKVSALSDENKILRRLLIDADGPAARPMMHAMPTPSSLQSLSLKMGNMPQSLVPHVGTSQARGFGSAPMWNHSGLF